MAGKAMTPRTNHATRQTPKLRATVFLALLFVWTIGCANTLRGANLLTATPASVTLTCSLATGPGTPATIIVKPAATLAAKETIAVTLGPVPGGMVVTAPSSATLTAANQQGGITYLVNIAPKCSGAATGSTAVKFNAAGVADISVPVTTTVVTPPSPLVMTPSNVVVTCVKIASYSAGPAQGLIVTSHATGGTPFIVDTTTVPSWLSVTPASGGLANAGGVALAFVAIPPCGNFAAGSSNSALIHLHNLPAADPLIPVTILVLGPSPLTATPATAVLAYTKGSATPAAVDIALNATATPAPTFTVDASSLPSWLTVDAASGAIPKTIHFLSTSVADSLSPGVYNSAVRVQVAGAADLALPFSLKVAGAPAVLSISEGAARNFTWTMGQPQPLAIVTLTSNDASIPYAITTAGQLAPAIASGAAKGVATSSGTPILVTFDQAPFQTALPGSVLTGSITVSWGTPAVTTVVNFKITVQAAGANVRAVSPLNIPTAAAGQKFTVALSGSGFLASIDPAQQTTVGIVAGGAIVSNANASATVVNASNIILVITVPATADPLLPFAQTGTGGTVVLGVCNPQGAKCTTPTSTATLTIGAYPVIQSVTSSSSFLQVTPPTVPIVSPYDMISLFGINFCVAAGKGCGTDTLYGAPDPVTLRYPLALTPDAAGAGQRILTVNFQSHSNPAVPIATAPLLFATDGQVNLVVPAEVAAYVGKTVDIVVNFGVTTGGAPRASAPFTVNVAATNPGIFAIGGDGQGDGAILSPDWSLIGKGNEAAMRQMAADSDVVQIYVTGLGVPDGTADNGSAGKGLWPSDCLSVASFLSGFNKATAGTSNSINGALILGRALNVGRLAPCLGSIANIPTVTIGGQPATVVYAGWSQDLVAGQYQLNVRLPGFAMGTFTTVAGDTLSAPLTKPVQLPVVVTARGNASQQGVWLWGAPRLKVTAPPVATLAGTAGVAWPSKATTVVAGGGTQPYQYAVSSGVLPAGLSLNAATGVIFGTPAADSASSYIVTVAATDSATVPLTGNVTLTLNIAAH